MTVYDNIWAFPIKRIQDYFISMGMNLNEDGSYSSEGCRILLYELLDRPLGNLSISQTRVIFSGENAEGVYNAFRLNFLSGGA